MIELVPVYPQEETMSNKNMREREREKSKSEGTCNTQDNYPHDARAKTIEDRLIEAVFARFNRE